MRTLGRQDAIDAVTRTLSSGLTVIEDSITELEHHWLVAVQSKRYLETRDMHDMVIGLGGTLVEKATGRLIELGGRHSEQEIVAMCEAGCFEFRNPDLVITAVDDVDKAVDLLAAMQIVYVVPEVVSGDTFRIPEDYTVEQLRAHLSHLPCRFNIRAPYFRYQAYRDLKRSDCMHFQLEENSGFVNQPLPNGEPHPRG